jgi:hypothetical protein
MNDTHKFPGEHNFEDFSTLSLHADSIIAKTGIRTDTAQISEDFIDHMCRTCDVVRDADGRTKCVAKISGKDMYDHALTDFRRTHPFFWHVDAPADLAHEAIVGGNITALGKLVSAIGIVAAEAEAKKYTAPRSPVSIAGNAASRRTARRDRPRPRRAPRQIFGRRKIGTSQNRVSI